MHRLCAVPHSAPPIAQTELSSCELLTQPSLYCYEVMHKLVGWHKLPLRAIVIVVLLAAPCRLGSPLQGGDHTEELVIQPLEDDALLVRAHSCLPPPDSAPNLHATACGLVDRG